MRSSMKKNGKLILLGICLLLCCCGCSKTEEQMEKQIFYLNMEKTRVVPVEYELPEENDEGLSVGGESESGNRKVNVDALAHTYLEALRETPESATLISTIPKDLEVYGTSFNGYVLTVDFSEDYYKIETTQEVLMRTAIVRTLLQIPAVTYVSFTVEGEHLVNVLGEKVGSMNADSFVENPGKQINSGQEAVLTLYFATSDGTKLTRLTRTVHYSSNISLEKLVMEQLIEGPRNAGAKATLPSDTRLITVSVVDQVCYVNLDETIMNQSSEITEEVLLYSIVNSLAELTSVDKVQISINGNTTGKLRYVYDLSNMYEPDYTYMDDYVSPTESEE